MNATISPITSQTRLGNLSGEDVHDRLREQAGDRKDGHVVGPSRRVDRHGVGHDDPGKIRVPEPLEAVLVQRSVRDEDPDVVGAVLLERLRSRDERAAGRRDVVADDCDLVAYPAGDLRHLDVAIAVASLVHDREARLDHLREADRVARAAGVRSDGDDAVPVQAEVAEVAREERQRGHVIDGDGEETLDLPGVQVHRQDPVGTGELEHVGDEASGDRLARLRLPVLPRVGEPRHDRGDPLRRRELRRLDHQQQLHQVAVDRLGSRLHDEDVGAADRLLVADVRLVVRKRLQLDVAELDVQVLGDPVGELRVRAPREDHQALLGTTLDPVPRLRLGRGRRHLEPREREISLRRASDGHTPPC